MIFVSVTPAQSQRVINVDTCNIQLNDLMPFVRFISCIIMIIQLQRPMITVHLYCVELSRQKSKATDRHAKLQLA